MRTKYKALATNEAVTRVVTQMPMEQFELLLANCAYRGESLRERIGRVAIEAGRLQDVSDWVVEVVG